MKNRTDNAIALRHYVTVVEFLSTFSKQSKILDVGCGEGILTKKLSKIGFNVYACDIDKKEFTNNKIVFKIADLNHRLPYPKKFFDVIICLEVIEHLQNPWLLIKELHRALKVNGVLIISSPNISNCLARIHCLFTGKIWLFKDHTTDHINPMSYWELESILKKIGFKELNLLDGVNVIDNVNIVTHIKNPLIKLIYTFVFKSMDSVHNLLNDGQKMSNYLFKSFSYIIYARK